MEYGAAVNVLRVAVNVGSSLGSAGLETNLALTMTIGTGSFARSSVAENLHPSHLVQCTRLAEVLSAVSGRDHVVGRDHVPGREP